MFDLFDMVTYTTFSTTINILIHIIINMMIYIMIYIMIQYIENPFLGVKFGTGMICI